MREQSPSFNPIAYQLTGQSEQQLKPSGCAATALTGTPALSLDSSATRGLAFRFLPVRFIRMKRAGPYRTFTTSGLKLVRKTTADGVYEYYPIGRYVVIAPGVCGGRPTFRGTRVEVRTVFDWLRNGRTIQDILKGYPSLSEAAVEEAIKLAAEALTGRYALQAA